MSNRLNLYPHLWGPHAWFFLDNIVFSYPEKPSSSDKDLFANFFNNIGKMLPCESCRKHYYKNGRRIFNECNSTWKFKEITGS